MRQEVNFYAIFRLVSSPLMWLVSKCFAIFFFNVTHPLKCIHFNVLRVSFVGFNARSRLSQTQYYRSNKASRSCSTTSNSLIHSLHKTLCLQRSFQYVFLFHFWLYIQQFDFPFVLYLEIWCLLLPLYVKRRWYRCENWRKRWRCETRGHSERFSNTLYPSTIKHSIIWQHTITSFQLSPCYTLILSYIHSFFLLMDVFLTSFFLHSHLNLYFVCDYSVGTKRQWRE